MSVVSPIMVDCCPFGREAMDFEFPFWPSFPMHFLFVPHPFQNISTIMSYNCCCESVAYRFTCPKERSGGQVWDHLLQRWSRPWEFQGLLWGAAVQRRTLGWNVHPLFVEETLWGSIPMNSGSFFVGTAWYGEATNVTNRSLGTISWQTKLIDFSVVKSLKHRLQHDQFKYDSVYY